MNSRIGICTNFGFCTRAGKALRLEAGEPLICPECGQPLAAGVAGSGRRVFFWGALILLVACMMIPAALQIRNRLQGGTAQTARSAGSPAVLDAHFMNMADKYFHEDGMQKVMLQAAKGDEPAVRRSFTAAPALRNSRGVGGVTLAHLALLTKDLTAFETLIKAGVDPSLQAENGLSAVMTSAMLPDARYLRAALKAGAPVDQEDRFRRRALHLAVRYRQLENVRLLLAAGADPNAADASGSTAWMAAFQGRRPVKEIVEVLRRHGVDTQHRDTAGLTAGDYAEAFGDAAIMSLMR